MFFINHPFCNFLVDSIFTLLWSLSHSCLVLVLLFWSFPLLYATIPPSILAISPPVRAVGERECWCVYEVWRTQCRYNTSVTCLSIQTQQPACQCHLLNLSLNTLAPACQSFTRSALNLTITISPANLPVNKNSTTCLAIPPQTSTCHFHSLSNTSSAFCQSSVHTTHQLVCRISVPACNYHFTACLWYNSAANHRPVRFICKCQLPNLPVINNSSATFLSRNTWQYQH